MALSEQTLDHLLEAEGNIRAEEINTANVLRK